MIDYHISVIVSYNWLFVSKHWYSWKFLSGSDDIKDYFELIMIIIDRTVTRLFQPTNARNQRTHTKKNERWKAKGEKLPDTYKWID